MPCRIFRIGVFFDGTGNTKIPDSSKGKMSNISKLSDLYMKGEFKDKLGKQTVGKMLYTNGVGTYDSDMENFFNPIDRKYDKGGGGGGAKRIYEMIDKVTVALDAHPYHKSDDNKFTKREIDVFGFSRGAAMARDFVNTFIENVINEGEKYLDVRFNFIGIYDTVGSFGEAGNDIDLKPKKKYIQSFNEANLPNGIQLNDENFGIKDPSDNKLVAVTLDEALDDQELARKLTYYKSKGWDAYPIPVGGHRRKAQYIIRGRKTEAYFFEPYNFDLAHKSANKIIHMTGHNEVRKNFPLTDIYGSSGEEWSLIGVHSDIGGGYAPKETEEFVFQTEYHTEEDAISQAKKLKQELNVKSGPYSLLGSWSILEPESVNYVLDGEMLVRMGTHNITLYRPKLQKVTPNHLALVTLQLMYDEAIRHFVPLNKPKPLPAYLDEYYKFAKLAKQNAYTFDSTKDGSSIRDVLSHHPARDPAHKYDHKISSVSLWDSLTNDNPEAGNDARYVGKSGEQVDGRKHPELADHVERAIYSNHSDNAVTPN